jgi:putative inorganic carbon (HCO3(-)) transporter
MLTVPMLWLLHWFVVYKNQRDARRLENKTEHENRSAFPPSALPLTPLNGALLVMALMVLVSVWATFDIGYSLPKISGMVLGMGVYFAVAREGARLRGWILSLLAFLGIGLGIAVLGIFGTSWFSSKITLLDQLTARLPKFITGLQGAESGFHPNEVAGALIWVLPLMMAILVALFYLPRFARNESTKAFSKGWQEKLRGWRLVGLIALCLAAAFFVGMILIALPRMWRLYSLAFLALLAVVLGILLASRWQTIYVWVTGSNLAADPALSLNTLEGRLEVWSRAIYGIQDFPFTGMGMNVFRKVLPVLYPLFLIGPDIDIGHAHNEFFQAALDLGIPGLIAFLALYIGAFWMLHDVWRDTRYPSIYNEYRSQVTRLLILGLGGGLLAHLLYGLTDTVALGAKPGILFWILLGLIAGLHQQARDAVAVEFQQ